MQSLINLGRKIIINSLWACCFMFVESNLFIYRHMGLAVVVSTIIFDKIPTYLHHVDIHSSCRYI